ncbi:MAG: hypothetical protein COA50_05775 [Flavobacteriaceae bacterium]|nr:MAG: hypothetical protein COA50_05775 [Flavobacteriaceae bacterium]
MKGNVSDFDQPISNVTVQVKGTDRKVKTDSEGNFNIKAQTGDVLVYTYAGRESTASVVNTTTNTLLVTMPLGVKNLDEVIL